jgi:hypothetical protein
MSKTLTLTYQIPEHVEAELSEDQIVLLFRDAIYEFSHRGSPARRDAETYVEKRYGKNPYFSAETLEEKVACVKTRVSFAEGLVQARVEVKVEKTEDEEEP